MYTLANAALSGISCPIVWWTILLAALPVILLIILMGFLKVSGNRSAVISFIVTAIIAIFAYKFPIADTGVLIGYGIIKAIFPILIIIIMAIFSYNVLVHTGKMNVLKDQFSSISSDRCIQVLLITWGFGGLLEGMAGFGTAVAIPAAILISLGFKPVFSSVVSLVSNSVATAFGAVGIPVKVLAVQAGITDVQQLSVHTVIQLSPLMLIIPFVLMFLTEPKIKALPKHIFVSIIVGVVSLAVQYVTAKYMGVETPAILGSIASIIVIIIYARIAERNKKDTTQKITQHSLGEITKAWSIYGLILILVIATSPLFPIRNFLSPLLTSTFNFNVFDIASGKDCVRSIKVFWLIDTGVLIFVATMIGGLIQGCNLAGLFKIIWTVVKQQKKTILTVCSLIVLSSIMDFSGMISVLGTALATATGKYYPLFAPLIGCLGTFITGSDTSSNIIFGKLQASVAHTAGINTSWLSAANTVGATGGKIISPQSIAIATSATKQQGQEGLILKRAILFAIGYIIISGLVVYFLVPAHV